MAKRRYLIPRKYPKNGKRGTFSKDSKQISRGTSSLLPCTVIVLLPYLQQEAFYYFGSALYWVVRLEWVVPTDTELTVSYCNWTDWYQLQLNWLVPPETELTGSLLKLNWLVPTDTELTGSYWYWTDWSLLILNWLVSTRDWTDWFLLILNWLVPTDTELTGSYWYWTDWFLQ
jgi:hypothetical protein